MNLVKTSKYRDAHTMDGICKFGWAARHCPYHGDFEYDCDNRKFLGITPLGESAPRMIDRRVAACQTISELLQIRFNLINDKADLTSVKAQQQNDKLVQDIGELFKPIKRT